MSLIRKKDDTFLFLFMAITASIKGWRHCRPVIVVDGTFLKASYGGTLLSACTQDGIGSIFPLAFSVVDSENDGSWVWFFTKIRQTFGLREGMCIVSDKHMRIETTIKEVYPEVFHGLCTYHLLNNLKAKFKRKNSEIRDPFIAAAKAYTNEEFQNQMSALDNRNVGEIRPYLSNIGYEKWTRLHCQSKRYFVMTSNIAESLNAATVAGRDLPVIALLKYLRTLVQDWTCRHQIVVKRSNDFIFKVTEAKKIFVLDLEKRTCTCNKFQMDEIPCPHALAVVKDLNADPYQYCSSYYMKETMKATYLETVYPIPHEGTWFLLEEINTMVILPPEGKAKSGRPKKRRHKAAWEKSAKSKCGRCGDPGHNRKTCRNQPKTK
ncbi:hypothetical protein DH2020_007424 [Rehmannia glutinosa]|uniref:SWIM-type domain-containing protein n=1 Tax=Rehmannia glutinosa TaxID=99300 RepID=A0ABR0TZ17_REHGL